MGLLDALKRLFSGSTPAPSGDSARPRAPAGNPGDGMARIGALRAQHAAELETTPAERMRVYAIFKNALDQDAHDYVDMVMAHPRREAVLELQVGVAMEAYFAGVMARRGWISEMDSQQAAFGLGRMFRQRLDALGVEITKVRLSIGGVIDNALREIAGVGFAGTGAS